MQVRVTYEGMTFMGVATPAGSGLYYQTYNYTATNAAGGAIWGQFRVGLIDCLGASAGEWVRADWVTVDGYSSGGFVSTGGSSQTSPDDTYLAP